MMPRLGKGRPRGKGRPCKLTADVDVQASAHRRPYPLSDAGLERNVVVRAAAGAHRGALEVRGVGRYVGARLEGAVAATSAAPVRVVRTRAQELDAFGDDFDSLALGAILRLPFAPVEPSLDGNRTTLGEVVGAILALRAPHGDVEVVGLVDPLAALTVLAAAVDSHAKLANRGSAGRRAQLRVLGQIPGDRDYVDVRSCHLIAPLPFVSEHRY